MELFAIAALVIIALLALNARKNRQVVAQEITSILPEQFVVFDLETTGLQHQTHKIIEIGAIKVNRDSNQHQTMQSLIRIKGKVPAKITEITGITDDMLKEKGIPLDEALDEFISFIGDLRLVAFNAEFDIGFMNSALDSCNKPELNNHVTCALDMARRAWPGRKSYRLKDLAKDGNLGNQDHRVISDCQMTMFVYMAAARKLNSST